MEQTLRGILHIVLIAWLFGFGQSLMAQQNACDLQWERTILPEKNGRSAGVCLTHDSLGNIYVAGTFENQLKIGNHLLTGIGKADMFLAKYNPNGELLWVRSAGSEKGIRISNLYLRENGQLFVIATAESSVYFPDTVYFLERPFYASSSWDTEGNFLKIISGHIFGEPLEIPEFGDSFAVKFYDIHHNRQPIHLKNSSDLFIGLLDDERTKIDSVNTLKWWLPIEVDGSAWITSKSGSPEHGYFFVGTFSGTLQIGDIALTSNGECDGFLLRVNEAGKITYARHLGGINADAINAVTVTPSGQVYITGSVTPPVQFGMEKRDGDSIPTFFLTRLSCGIASDCTAPDEVRVNKITENSLTIQWEETAETQAYDVQFKKPSESEWQTRRTVNSPLALENLTEGTNYHIRIRKVCADGLSPFSQEIEARTLEPAPTCTAPRDFSIRAIHPTFASVQWFEKTKNSAIASYKIFYRKKGIKQWQTVETSANSIKIEGLEPLTEYETKVAVTCTDGFKNDTTPIRTFTTIRLDACPEPFEVSAVHILHRSAHIRWKTTGESKSYRVQWKAVGTKEWQSANTSLNAIVLFGLNPATAYEVRLRAKCDENSYSPYSEPIVFKTLKDCEPSGNLLVPDVTLTTAWVVWDSVPNGKKYDLFYKAKQEVYWKNVSTTNRYTQITGLNPDTRYEIKLRVNCGDTASSNFSAVTELSTLPSQACGTVENVVILPGVDHAVMRWKPAKLASGYVIQWRLAHSTLPWTTVTLKDPQTRQYTIQQLSGNATYAVRIISQCESVLQPFERTFATMTDAKASPTLKATALSAFPNPAKEKLKIDYNIGKEESATLEVYNLVGKRIYHQSLTRATGYVELDVSDWESGVYFCRLYIDEEKNYLQKIAVTK